MPTYRLLVPLALILAACSKSPEPASDAPTTEASQPATDAGPVPGVDYHSHASTTDFVTRHLALDLVVDFERRVLEGTATLDVERTGRGDTLVLDTRDLVIEGVRAGGEPLAEVPFRLGEPVDVLGAPLSIEMPEGADRVEITYRTSPEASGLQWLEPRQTAGRRHPFLFSQAQPIHARSFVPLQDTPAVRITYEATIRVPPALRAVMSANNGPERAEDGVYTFRMPQPIPSYLIALVVSWVVPGRKASQAPLRIRARASSSSGLTRTRKSCRSA